MSQELEALKRKADTLGVTYSPNIGVETLRARINEKLEGSDETAEAVAAEPVAAPSLNKAQRHRQLRKDATKMVRCRITCMNPSKQDVPGEIIAVSNSVIGVIKHFVPFGEVTDNGWHIPQIIYDEIKERKCTIMRKKRDSKGSLDTHEPVQIREFAIEVLPALTETELKELAQRQAMASGTAAAVV
ncbi:MULTISPECIES: hypothetical protein [Pantoea]|jgi:hypothetical protein|uniref:Uncharacterized protein n=1 Tax=Pantoea brenneri TaxID=472694 RepID=A0A7Y6NH06_9GAMM|nr:MULTISPECIES: hypothetical protein [Pantoea]MBZ6397058.1 hypothetical protein [Pantoea sp.]MBZ6440191.1 hypothetical protein [Pantoea sp.]NUY43447.1 hypothetical protein [Pantoea brenneri]NUY50987.1 hypothetical protein [Pantoea brenneri]NUY61282.1 hypothetical protein [Pantoea brenneri]